MYQENEEMKYLDIVALLKNESSDQQQTHRWMPDFDLGGAVSSWSCPWIRRPLFSFPVPPDQTEGIDPSIRAELHVHTS